jgi:hypothetical protein
MSDIEPPYNNYISKTVGPSGEQVYWAPIGSIYPVCPDDINKEKITELFDEATLIWADICCVVDFDLYKAAQKSKKKLELLKLESFDKGILFTSISSIPLDEEYFENNYYICYFASQPYKLSDNLYITVGVIGP